MYKKFTTFPAEVDQYEMTNLGLWAPLDNCPVNPIQNPTLKSVLYRGSINIFPEVNQHIDQQNRN